MCQPTSLRARQAGFNLIEAAIVLGVIGLVVGGIWVAASTVLARQQAQVVTLFFQEVEALTHSYKKEIQASSTPVYDVLDMNNIVVAKNMLPSGITALPDSSTHFFLGPGVISSFFATISPPRNIDFIAEFHFYPTFSAAFWGVGSVPKPITCIQLVQDILRRNPTPGQNFMLYMQSEAAALLTYTPPAARPTPQQISAACAQTAYLYIYVPL